MKEQTATVLDAASVTTRQTTPEGFLRGQCVVTRTGVLDYDSSELGLEGAARRVRVRQTEDSVFHPETSASVQNAPVTIGHPDDGVKPATFRQLSVGSVGTPKRIGDDRLGADILFGDATAISLVHDVGVDQLSVGKEFRLRPSAEEGVDYETVGPIHTNHIAVVERGRAGPDVRVLDNAPPGNVQSDHTQEASHMTPEQLAQITAAIQAGMDGGGGGRDIAAVVRDEVAPLIKRIQDSQDAADRDRAAAEGRARAEELKQAMTTAVDSAYQDGYKRGISEGETRSDALALIGDAALRDQVSAAPLKDILVAAVQDVVPGAGSLDEATLRGVLLAKRGMQDRGVRAGDPFPATVFRHAQDAAEEARQKNLDDYHKAIDRALADGVIGAIPRPE